MLEYDCFVIITHSAGIYMYMYNQSKHMIHNMCRDILKTAEMYLFEKSLILWERVSEKDYCYLHFVKDYNIFDFTKSTFSKL